MNSFPLAKVFNGLLRRFPHRKQGGHAQDRFDRIVKTAGASAIARAIGILTSLVSIPLTFRYLGAERFGIWIVLISFISVLSFIDFGIGSGLINAVADAYGRDDRHRAQQAVSSAALLMTALAACFCAAGAAASPWLPWTQLLHGASGAAVSEGKAAFLVMFCWFVLNIPLSLVTRVQAGMQRTYTAQIVVALGNIASLLALLAVIASQGTLPELVLASISGVVLATAVNLWLLLRDFPWLMPSVHACHAASLSTMMRVGVLFFVLQCCFAIAYTSDNLVIAQVLGPAAVAAFAIPQKLFSSVDMVVNMGIAPLWPAYGEAFARGDVAWVRKAFWGSLRLTLAITLPLCSALAFAGPWILRVVAGRALRAPLALMIALGVWGVVSALSTAVATMLNGTGVVKPQVLLVVCASLCNLGLSIFLTQRLGAVGVCLGSILTQVFVTWPFYCLMVPRLLKSWQTIPAPVPA
jgi:O-antigen/teichoic acid export membrane protein